MIGTSMLFLFLQRVGDGGRPADKTSKKSPGSAWWKPSWARWV